MSAANDNEREQHKIACELADNVYMFLREKHGVFGVTTNMARQVRDYLCAHPVPSDFFNEPGDE